jgi:predicted transcriptional regulator
VTWKESEGESGMKVKKIFVGVKPLDDVLKEAGETFERLTKGKAVKQKRAVYFVNLKEMRRVLTEKRLEILKAIRDRKPSSVYALARMVDRDLKNVLQDISYLQELGIVTVTETGMKKIPHFDYDRISIEVAV